MSSPKIIPVIMSGGAGSRLWPLSRQAMPKQLLPLVTDKTMVQETAARFNAAMFGSPVFICNAKHADPISSQMKAAGVNIGAIITEPAGRNTAPCAVVAAEHVQAIEKGALVLLVPADHHVTRPDVFRSAIERAVSAANEGRLVTFGIQPDRPETGYGYIERGEALYEDVYCVNAFREKPDTKTAKAYLESGKYAWNAGIFLFSPRALLTEMNRFEPEICASARAAYQKAKWADAICSLDAQAFEASPSQSIDYAVMEKTDHAAIVPVDMGWSDIGSFAALYDVISGGEGNISRGDTLCENTSGSLILSDGPMVATVGVENVAVIVQDGKVMVLSLDAAQDVKKIVDGLKSSGRSDLL